MAEGHLDALVTQQFLHGQQGDTKHHQMACEGVSQPVIREPLGKAKPRVMDSFLAGLDDVGHPLDALRAAPQPEKWPYGENAAYLASKKALGEATDREECVSKVFTDVGHGAARLRGAVRALEPGLQAEVDRARTHLATTTVLVDSHDEQIERHRRLLENSRNRQLGLLAALRAAAQVAASSGSYERPEPLELRVIGS